MLRFLAQRLIQMALLFVAFLTMLFFLLEAQPGDITAQFLSNPRVPPEARQLLAERLGLDKPLVERYFVYMGNFFTGELGVSFTHYPKPVIEVIGERLPRTILLFLSAILLAYYLGFTFGKVLAWRRGRNVEQWLTLGGVGLYTVFYPWFGLMMIWFFSFILGWFPIGGFITVSVWRGAPYTANQVIAWVLGSAFLAMLALVAVKYLAWRLGDPRRRVMAGRVGTLAVWGFFLAYWWTAPMRPYAFNLAYHTMLPVFTLASVAFAGIMLLTRSSMLETLREDYILTARAKGLPDRMVRDRHAARNALLPVVTSLVLALAFVIGGGVITELVFSWPGMGGALLEAVIREDIPLAIGALSFIGVLALVGHLIVDILYTYLDPRIRVQSSH